MTHYNKTKKQETTKVSQGQLCLQFLSWTWSWGWEKGSCIWLVALSHPIPPPAFRLFILRVHRCDCSWSAFPTEGTAASPSWWLRELLRLSEDIHSLSLWGFLPGTLLFAHFPPATRKITHLLWDTTAPLFRHLSWCLTLCAVLSVSRLCLSTNLHFFRGRDCLVYVTPSAPSTGLGRLLLLGKYWLKEWINV